MLRQKRLALGVVLGLSLLAVPAATTAQRPGSEVRASDFAELGARVERFLERISEGRVEVAYDELLAESLILDDAEQMADLVEKTRGALGTLGDYGPFVGVERVRADSVGSSLVYLRYLYKTGRLPMVWYCTFYRPRLDADWTLVAVRFDTELEGLFHR